MTLKSACMWVVRMWYRGLYYDGLYGVAADAFAGLGQLTEL